MEAGKGVESRKMLWKQEMRDFSRGNRKNDEEKRGYRRKKKPTAAGEKPIAAKRGRFGRKRGRFWQKGVTIDRESAF